MPGTLAANGGERGNPIPLYTSAFWTGLYTNRSPIRSAGSAYEEKYRGSRLDALITGSNMEISPALTLARRPGNPSYNTQTFNAVDAFYSFREFSSNTEQIRVMVDETSALYDGTANSRTLVFTKSSGAGQTYMQSVGNNLFFGNGIDQKKWVQSLFTRTSSASGIPNIGNSVTLTSAATPFLSTYLVDSNGNLQQLLATRLTSISNVGYVSSTNVLTLTVGSTAGMVAGDLQVPWGLTTALWLNGCTISVISAVGTTVTASLLNESHANYGPAADTGSLAKASGGSPVTGGSVPTWSTTVPASGNNYQGGITVDGTALWLNKGNPTENWGIVAGATSPTFAVGNAGSAWRATTFYSLVGVIIDSNGNLQQVTTAGLSGTVAPTWATVLGNTTTDGTVVWTMLQTAASLVWTLHTAYTAGKFITPTDTGGTKDLFQLAAFTTPYVNGTISCDGWNIPHSSGGAFPYANGAAPAPAFTFNAPSLSWHGATGANVFVDQINGAGEITGTFDTGHYEDWGAAIKGTLHIRVPGTYSFNLNTDDGGYVGFGNGAIKVSGTAINTPGTLTAIQGYTIFAGNNNSGSHPANAFSVNFPTAGDYGFEIDWMNWEHAATMNLTCNGQVIITTATPISGASTPLFPVWSTSFAPNYPSVNESANQFKWNNLGPATDATWHASTNFTLANTTITDPNNNEEDPYRAGVSGTSVPTFSTGLNQLTLDNPDLIWINKGPASAPAPGTISAFNGGYQYVVALVNSATNTVSNASPFTEATGNFVGANGIQITGGLPATASIDPQADYVAIFRTTDGQTTPFLIPGTGNSIYTVPLSQYLQNGYLDTANDTELNNLIEAPIGGENTPPAAGAKNLAYHLSRIFFSIGNTVYWTSGPDTPVGNGVEGVAPANNQVFPSLVTRIVPTVIGAFVFTVSDIYIIVGQGTASNPIQPAYPYAQGIGLLSYNMLGINGSVIGFFASDNTFNVMDPNAGAFDELGRNICNLLQVPESWNPSNGYVTWHSSGEDKAWFIADGSTGWYRVCPTPSPETGVTWSPFATIVGGVKAVQSIETSPGVHKLLLGPATSGPILNRDLNTFTDGSTAYTCSATVGSVVLAVPGQVAACEFVAVDAVRRGTQPYISVLLNEAYPYYTGPFDPLPEGVNDPTDLAESDFQTTSMYALRFYFSQTQNPAVCRSMQWRVDFPAEAVKNELITATIYGQLMAKD